MTHVRSIELEIEARDTASIATGCQKFMELDVGAVWSCSSHLSNILSDRRRPTSLARDRLGMIRQLDMIQMFPAMPLRWSSVILLLGETTSIEHVSLRA